MFSFVFVETADDRRLTRLRFPDSKPRERHDLYNTVQLENKRSGLTLFSQVPAITWHKSVQSH